MFFALPNLVSSSITECTPWADTTHQRPELADKAAFATWIKEPTTDHVFFSAFRGSQPNIRVSETNHPVACYGFVVDVDSPPDPSLIERILRAHRGSTVYAPQWFCRTVSGNFRLVYVFPEPVLTYTLAISKRFLKRALAETNLKRLRVGAIDKPAAEDPAKYYELGTEWTAIPGATPLGSDMLRGWVNDVLRDHKWTEEGTVIPIESLREEASRRFGDRWPGGWERFDIGARGLRFWDPSARDITSATIHPAGVSFFTDGGGFRSWEALFGTDFVRQWNTQRIGHATADIFRDGSEFWYRPDDESHWVKYGSWDAERSLRLRGLKSTKERGSETSEIDQAMEFVATRQNIQEHRPALYAGFGPYQEGGNWYFGTCEALAMPPADLQDIDPAIHFPNIVHFLENFFEEIPDSGPTDPQQADIFLAWLRRSYRGAYNRNMQVGHALVIAGPSGSGKNFIESVIVSPLMGGKSQSAEHFLIGNDQFNSKLFASPVWTLHDAVAPGDGRARARFTQGLKQIVANAGHKSRGMRVEATTIEWRGRVIITLNDDPDSVAVLPTMENSTMDKILLLLAKVGVNFESGALERRIRAELPAFAAWLLHDEGRQGIALEHDARYGFTAFQHPSLMQAVEAQGEILQMEEIIESWRTMHFQGGNRNVSWEGTSTELYNLLADYSGLRDLLQPYRGHIGNGVCIGKSLSKLVKAQSHFPQDRRWIFRRSLHGRSIYTVHPPTA